MVDVTYDRSLTHAELVAGGTRLELAFAEGGILPLVGWALHALYPERFTSEKAAERALECEKPNYWLASLVLRGRQIIPISTHNAESDSRSHRKINDGGH